MGDRGRFEHVSYDSLTARQKELLNFQKNSCHAC